MKHLKTFGRGLFRISVIALVILGTCSIVIAAFAYPNVSIPLLALACVYCMGLDG